MSGTGRAVSFGGTATTTETRVTIPNAYRKGYPNANPAAGAQTYPTPKPSPVFLKNLRIVNQDPTNNLLVRINNSTTQNVVQPKDHMEFDHATVFDLTVQASLATVAWDGIGAASS